MSFLFNFTDPNSDIQSDKDTTDTEELTEATVLPYCEIEENEKKVGQLISVLKSTQYSLSSGLCITYLDNQEVEELIKGDNSEKNHGILTALQTHSDLIPHVYEGGLKVWECSIDLIEYLDKRIVKFEKKSVLELGCGAGLPGIYSMVRGAELVHFQDYNAEVLETYTIPNVYMNKKAQTTCECRYFSGDWSHFKDKLVADKIKYGS